MRRALSVMLAVLALCCLVGCGGEEQTGNDLIGTWIYEGDRETEMEFFEDGSLRVLSDGNEMQGSYTLDGSQIEMKIEEQSQSGIYQIDGDQLTIDFESETVTFTKKS